MSKKFDLKTLTSDEVGGQIAYFLSVIDTAKQSISLTPVNSQRLYKEILNTHKLFDPPKARSLSGLKDILQSIKNLMNDESLSKSDEYKTLRQFFDTKLKNNGLEFKDRNIFVTAANKELSYDIAESLARSTPAQSEEPQRVPTPPERNYTPSPEPDIQTISAKEMEIKRRQEKQKDEEELKRLTAEKEKLFKKPKSLGDDEEEHEVKQNEIEEFRNLKVAKNPAATTNTKASVKNRHTSQSNTEKLNKWFSYTSKNAVGANKIHDIDSNSYKINKFLSQGI